MGATLVAMVAVAGLVLGACGGDDDGRPAFPGGPGTTTASGDGEARAFATLG